MPCIPIPQLKAPTLPAGISLGIQLPKLPTLPGLCCIKPPKLPIKIPTSLGVAIPLPGVALVKQLFAEIDALLAQLDIPCPRQ